MQVEIRFDNLMPSPAVEADVRKRAAKLQRFMQGIVSCRVTVKAPHKRRQQGNLYSVTVDVRFPGGEIVASREPSADHAHEDVYVAVRDAFKAVRRRLQDRERRRRGDVKQHEAAAERGSQAGSLRDVGKHRIAGRLRLRRREREAVTNDTERRLPNARGLDVHGAEPVSHRFTITDADGNPDVELNLAFPLTHRRHTKLEHLLEEGYSEHEAYVLIAGGEIVAHIEAIKDKKAKRPTGGSG